MRIAHIARARGLFATLNAAKFHVTTPSDVETSL
jgi:hypothetical protein